MTEIIRQTILDSATLFGFEFNGKSGNIDPCYMPSEGQSFLLFFDGEEQTVYSLAAVMNTPFLEGQSLVQAADTVKITDW